MHSLALVKFLVKPRARSPLLRRRKPRGKPRGSSANANCSPAPNTTTLLTPQLWPMQSWYVYGTFVYWIDIIGPVQHAYKLVSTRHALEKSTDKDGGSARHPPDPHYSVEKDTQCFGPRSPSFLN